MALICYGVSTDRLALRDKYALKPLWRTFNFEII